MPEHYENSEGETTKEKMDVDQTVHTITNDDSILAKLRVEYESALEYQKRRYPQWAETYNLYRDIIETNELTQRQEVNVPIMKETKKTLISKIGKMPEIEFHNLEKTTNKIDSKQKEIFVQTLWEDDNDNNKEILIDKLEKDNVILFGRSHKKINWKDGRVAVEVPDNKNILIDPKTNPVDIDTAHYIIHKDLERTLKSVVYNEKYDKKAREQLASSIIAAPNGGNSNASSASQNSLDENQQAQDEEKRDLGIIELEKLGGFEQKILLNEHFTEIWDDKKKEFIKYVCITANNNTILLYKKTLKDTLGVDFWPFTTWADDLDAKDYWCDGIGDVVRVPNKVVNIFFSQMIENRSYRNLGMKWYLPTPGFDPQSFEPEPFGMYPAPLVKNITGGYMTVDQVIRDMQIPELEDNLVSIDFLIKLIERATAATAQEKGVAEKKQITLGEVQQLAEQSATRIADMAKFYEVAQKEYARKWLALYHANLKDTDKIKLYKKASEGYFEQEISAKDIKSSKGFKIISRLKDIEDAQEVEEINKIITIKNQLPENVPLKKVAEKRLLEFLDLTPEELRQIEEEQKKIDEQMSVVQQNQATQMAGMEQNIKKGQTELQGLTQ